MALVIRWMIVGMMALLPPASHAMALGKLKVLSALNEPLNAEIEFTSVTEKELKGLSVALASRADFDGAGIDRLPLLSQIKFIVSKKLDGRYFIELRTDQQLDEPFLHLLLQVEWTGGRLVREYTALIDPPYKIAGKAAAVEVPVITAPAPAAEAQPSVPSPPVAETPPAVVEAPPAEAQKADTPKEEAPPVVAQPEEPKVPEELKAEATSPQEEIAKAVPPAETLPEETKLGPPEVSQGVVPEEFAGPKVEPLEAAPKEEIARAPGEEAAVAPEPMPAPESAPAAMSEYNVKRGDTLWAIAEKARADDKDVTVEQVILAIYRTNKHAFFGNNVNNLKAGKILKIPEREEVGAVASPQARREFRAQYDAWQEYKLKLASASGAIKVTETPEAAPKAAVEMPAAPVDKKEEVKPPKPAPSVTDKGKQDELLKIVRNTLQQEKSTPDKKVAENESAKDVAVREQLALAERAATLEESLESKRLENKDLSEKVGVVRSQLKKESRLIELESQSLAQQKPAPETKPAEPAPKPVEPVAKPAEPPAAPKPVEAAKVEPLAPVKPAEAPPVTPKVKRIPPPPAPAAEKDFLSSILEAVQSDLLMPVVIGIVVLLSGGIALVYFRRRQKSIAEFEESILSADAISTDQPVTTGDITGQPQAAAAAGGDTSFLSDFSQGGMGNIHTDEVDPVAEAEVYLAYGRDETAEEILKEAMVKNPDRQELKLKLLEIYHQRNDAGAFETLAEELYAALGGRGGKIWTKVEEMGRKLNPENPMFRGGAPAKAPASAPPAKPAAPAAATAKPESAGDFDFDIESTAAATAGVRVPARDGLSVTMAEAPAVKTEPATSFESLDLGTAVDSGLDFDISALDEAATPDFNPPAAPASAGNEIKWEPEPTAVAEADLETAAPAGNAQASGQWDETATKLDLAKAYIDMGDAEGARSILQEVMAEGSEAQKKQAHDLSAQIA